MASPTSGPNLDMDDITAISNLVHSYAERLDAGDLDAVAALFEHAEFGSADRSRPLRGLDEIRRVFDGVRLYGGIPRTRHVISNLAIDLVSPARAHARCSFTVFQATDGMALQPILAGRYHDAFERTSSGWEFRHRVIHVDSRGDLARHMGE